MRVVCQILLALAAIGLLTACMPAANRYTEPLSLAEPVPADPSLLRATLDNGFSYWIRSTNVSSANHTIEIRLIVNVGSVDEGSFERGYAHLLEHVVFRAAESAASLDSLLAEAGLRWGADINAFTFPDHTEYRFSFSAEQADFVPRALRFASALLDDLKIDSRHVDPEKKIVEAEWRSRRGADPQDQNAYLRELYAGSRWLHRPPLGDLADLRQATAASLQTFWQRHYTPDNATLIVTGKIDPIALAGQIKTLFGGLQTRPAVARSLASGRVGRSAHRAVALTRPDAGEPYVEVEIHRNLQMVSDFASLQDTLIERVSWGVLRRAVSAAVRASRHCTAYRDSLRHYARRWSAMRLRAVPIDDARHQHCGSVLHAALDGSEKLLADDLLLDRFIAAERARIRNILGSRERQTPHRMARSLVRSLLLESVPLSPSFASAQSELILNAAGRETVRARIRDIVAEPRLYVAVAPTRTRSELPSAAQFLNTVQAAVATAESLYSSPELQLDAAAAETGPTASIDRTNSGRGWSSWRLSNGVQVYLYPSAERSGVVAIHMVDAGGYADLPASMRTEARYLAGYHDVVAFGARSARAVGAIEDELQLHIDTNVSAHTHSIAGVANTEDLGELFRIVADLARPLANSNYAWKFRGRVRQWQQANLGTAADAVQAVYRRRMTLGAAAERHRNSLPPVSQAGFESAHRALFQTAREPVFVVYGDLSRRRLEALLPATLGHLVRAPEAASPVRFRQRLAAGRENRVAIRVGRNDGSFRDSVDVHLFHHCTNQNVPYDKFLSGHRVLAEILSRRLSDRIRESLGLSYRAAVSFEPTDKFQQLVRYRGEFVVAAAQQSLLLSEIDRIIAELGRSGVRADEVSRVTAQIEIARQLQSKYPLRRAAHLAGRLRQGYVPARAASLVFAEAPSVLVKLANTLAAQCFGRSDNRSLLVSRIEAAAG